MFCFQCEQTAKGTGCTISGVCGKQPDVASLQDLLIHQLKGIGYLADSLRKIGIRDSEADIFTIEALFTTVTNVNFDSQAIIAVIKKGDTLKKRLSKLLIDSGADINNFPEAARFTIGSTETEMIAQGAEYGILSEQPNEDIRSLQQLLTYGLKGMAAYADHAYILGKTDDAIFAFFS